MFLMVQLGGIPNTTEGNKASDTHKHTVTGTSLTDD